ncbi:MAG: helix-turn-helix domain-containing protein [Gaiellaceae bacterium]
MTARERLAGVLSADLLSAIDELVTERVTAALAEAGQDRTWSPWMEIAPAADYLRVSERTLQRLIEKGRIRSSTIGRRRLLHRDDLDALARATTGEEKRQPLHPAVAEE